VAPGRTFSHNTHHLSPLEVFRSFETGLRTFQRGFFQDGNRTEETMSKQTIALVIAACFSWPALAQSSSGWQTLTDHRQVCEAKSPQGWEKFLMGPKGSLGIARVVAQTYRDGSSFSFDFAKSAGGKATQVFEDGPTRYWIAFDPKTASILTAEQSYRFLWFVAIPTTPVCSVLIFFDDPSLTEQAKLIVKSLKAK
jgi:hypothetical protein